MSTRKDKKAGKIDWERAFAEAQKKFLEREIEHGVELERLRTENAMLTSELNSDKSALEILGRTLRRAEETILAKDRELDAIRKEFESLVHKNRRSADVSAVLSAFFLSSRSALDGVKHFAATAIQMGLTEKILDMYDPLRLAFRRGGDEVQRAAFAKSDSSELDGLLDEIGVMLGIDSAVKKRS